MDKEGRLHEGLTSLLFKEATSPVVWQEACVGYLMAVNGGERQRITDTLTRLVGLCKLDSQFIQLARLIPNDGSPLEGYYLKRVVEICPGE